MIRPALRAKYRVESVPGQGVFLLSETETHVLEGPHVDVVLSLVDGLRTVDDIVRDAQPVVAPGDVVGVLDVLQSAGHLVDGVSQLPTEFAAFWSEIGIDDRVHDALGHGVLETSAHGMADAAGFELLSASFGVRTAPYGNLHVAVTDDYLRPTLAPLNRWCLARGVPLLLIKPVGVKIWIGPLVVPGRTACWECLQPRLAGNREVETFILRRTGRDGPLPVARARVGLFEQQAYGLALAQIAQFLAFGFNRTLEGRLLVGDITSLAFEFHDLVRRPQCPACASEPAVARAGNPISIGASPARNADKSGSRAESPELTFLRLRHHISPVTGIVKEVVPSVWHGAGPIRVYVAGHNFALKNDELVFLKDGLRTHSSGKGRTDAQARTSALCEALERFSGVFQGDETRVNGALGDVEGAIDPRESMLFSDRQYREREQWLARQARFQVVPLPFDERAAIDWSPVWSLTSGRRRYLPTSYLYYNVPTVPESFYCWADSNGAAAGATVEEALLQGLLEVVERDAVAIWWYNRLARPAVDLDAFDAPFADEVRDFYAQLGRDVWALDLTTDVGIPAFVALTRRTRGPTEDIIMGFGAHLDPSVALTRALTEMNQFSPAVLSTLPDGSTMYGVFDRDAIEWWKTATAENQPYLMPGPEPARTPGDFGSRPIDDAGVAVTAVVARLESLGHEVLVLDQTRPEVGLPVVKAIVPGMRHFWARFAPGRLYDVPVRTGAIERPLRESDLNPIAMFL